MGSPPPEWVQEEAAAGRCALLQGEGGWLAGPQEALHQEPGLHLALLGRPRLHERATVGHEPASGPATLARAWLERGAQALADLTGPYALAVLHGGTLHLAVDLIGRERLCWQEGEGVVQFASDARLLAGDGAAPDPQALLHYLFFHVVPSPLTAWPGVRKLEPGQHLEHRGGRTTLRFHALPRYLPERRPLGELAGRFRDLLQEAVGRALPEDGPVAAFLSGGTDSSTVCGMARRLGREVRAYSIGFDAEGYDESRYAEAAVRHFGLRHKSYRVTPEDVVRAVPVVAEAYDEPFGNASAVPTYYCARLAREDGAAAMLAGDGGDEIFAGNERYADQWRFELLARQPAPVRALAALAARSLPGPLGRKARSYVDQAAIPLPDRLERYNLLLRQGFAEVLHPELLGRVETEAPLALLREVYRRPEAASALHRMLYLDLKQTLADNDLRKVTTMAAAAGVAVRYPLLDDELVAFAASLPEDLLLRRGRLRWFFKEALRDFLPREILTKPKHGFGLPFGVWLREHPGLRELAGDSLASLRERRIVRADYVDRLLDRRLAEHAAYYGTMVWVLMMLEQWLQRHAPRFGH